MQEKLHEEFVNVLGEEDITADVLSQLKYDYSSYYMKSHVGQVSFVIELYVILRVMCKICARRSRNQSHDQSSERERTVELLTIKNWI